MKHIPYMNWTQLMSTTRFIIQDQHVVELEPRTNSDPYRTAFHVDYDRLVFSNAFRRLGRKTQVHPLAKHDHTHNRLTHSVEVASVGRSLGRKVGGILAKEQRLPKGLTVDDFGIVVQVACLAHDLGNPPFGHTGEEIFRQWFRDAKHQPFLTHLTAQQRQDIQTYEGNAHSLRQVASLEMYTHQGGMRLTAASIGTLIKYPWTSSHPQYGSTKFNIYQTELTYMQHIAQHLGLIQKSDDCWARHPLSYLMEAADDICYALMDLEDAVELELLDYRIVMEILQPLAVAVQHKLPQSPREKIAMMRGAAIGQAIENIADVFARYEQTLLSGQFDDKQDLLDLADDQVKTTLNNAKNLAREQIFNHRSKQVHELAAFRCLGSLLDLFIPAVHNRIVSPQSLNREQQIALNLLMPNTIEHYSILTNEHDLYHAYMSVLDYIGAMTDNRAAHLAGQLSGVNML